MKHETIWQAVDNLAKKNKISVSGMAKMVGLDATTFNKSKRHRKDGKKRWPSLSSINKLLHYFEIDFDEFCEKSALDSFSSLPLTKYSEINLVKNKKQKNWQEMGQESLKNLDYAIILDTKKYEPIYKYNSTIILGKNVEMRRGDRVFVTNKFYEACLYEFIADKNNFYEFLNLENLNIVEKILHEDIICIKRIAWASQ